MAMYINRFPGTYVNGQNLPGQLIDFHQNISWIACNEKELTQALQITGLPRIYESTAFPNLLENLNQVFPQPWASLIILNWR